MNRSTRTSLAVVVTLLVLGTVTTLVRSTRAQEEQPGELVPGRYEFASGPRAGLILDRFTGMVYGTESTDAAFAFQPFERRGELGVCRDVPESELPPFQWQPAATGTVPRYTAVAIGNGKPAVFDTATGRLAAFEPGGRGQAVVFDPVRRTFWEGSFAFANEDEVTQQVQERRAERARREQEERQRQLDSPSEARMIGALKTIASAQVLFREGDKDYDGVTDYGTLAELAEHALIDARWANGRVYGYVLEVRPDPEAPEFVWQAIARPVDPDSGLRCLMVNQSGTIYTADRPFTFTEGGAAPDHATPLGR